MNIDLNKDSLKSVVKKSIAPQVILGKKLKKRQQKNIDQKNLT